MPLHLPNWKKYLEEKISMIETPDGEIKLIGYTQVPSRSQLPTLLASEKDTIYYLKDEDKFVVWQGNKWDDTGLTFTELDVRYVTKTEFGNKADKSNTYTKSDVDTFLKAKSDSTHTHDELHEHVNKIELDRLGIVDGFLTIDGVKQAIKETDLSDYFTKSEVETLVQNVTVDLSDYYDKQSVDTLVEGITSPDLSSYAKKTDIPDITSKADKNHVHTEIEDHENRIEALEQNQGTGTGTSTPVDLSDYYTKNDVYNKQEVDTKLANVGSGTGSSVDLSDYALKTDIPDVTSKANKTDLDDKADKNHTHTDLHTHANKSDLDKLSVQDGQLSIDGVVQQTTGAVIDDTIASKGSTYSSEKIEEKLVNKADTGHAHAISDITDLETTLQGKASTNHNHKLDELSDVDNANKTKGRILEWDGSKHRYIDKPITDFNSMLPKFHTEAALQLEKGSQGDLAIVIEENMIYEFGQGTDTSKSIIEKMTSNIAPSPFVLTASSYMTGNPDYYYQPYRAFDGDMSTSWVTQGNENEWVIIDLGLERGVKGIKISFNQYWGATAFNIFGSSTGRFEGEETLLAEETANTKTIYEKVFNNKKPFQFVKIELITGENTRINIFDIQVYGNAWGKLVDIDGFANGFADIVHSHTESDIVGLNKYTKEEVDTFLLAKQEKGDYAPLTHTHEEYALKEHLHEQYAKRTDVILSINEFPIPSKKGQFGMLDNVLYIAKEGSTFTKVNPLITTESENGKNGLTITSDKAAVGTNYVWHLSDGIKDVTANYWRGQSGTHQIKYEFDEAVRVDKVTLHSGMGVYTKQSPASFTILGDGVVIATVTGLKEPAYPNLSNSYDVIGGEYKTIELHIAGAVGGVSTMNALAEFELYGKSFEWSPYQSPTEQLLQSRLETLEADVLSLKGGTN